MYNYNAMERILKLRSNILNMLKGKLQGFLMAGGTALSLYYFNHRESYDLDFFTKDFSVKKVTSLISVIEKELGITIKLLRRQSVKKEAEIIVCHIPVVKDKPVDVDDNKTYLKIDFIEDVYRDIAPNNLVANNIPVMSKENIYLRKIYAACGIFKIEDETGRKRFIGGRQEAKDFFDLYYLSQIFMPLSIFASRYCTLDEQESIVRWYRTYDRFSMKTGMLDIITEQKIDYNIMEQHFASQANSLIEEMVK